MPHLHHSQATESSLVSHTVLLTYRFIMFLWCIYIGCRQLNQRGPVVFCFFTVWNWWLMTTFFALATVASLQRTRNKEKRDRANLLDKVVVVLFTVEAPMAIVIDLITWTVLVPMLLEVEDAEKREHWLRVMYGFESYNQHGFNAVMMLGECVLNKAPPLFWTGGWVAIWNSLFGVWSAYFIWKFQRPIYPFLDAEKPYAWLAYLGLFVVNWSVTFAFMALIKTKQKLIVALTKKKSASYTH